MPRSDAPPSSLRHDLATPIAVIVGFADLLVADRELDKDTRRDYAERIRTAAAELRARLDADDLV